jgi:hypothetical protein
MAKVAIFDDTPRRCVQFDEDTEVRLSYLSKEEALALNKEVDKIVSRTGADRSVIWNQKLGQRCVHGWRNMSDHSHPGLVYPDGRPIPYSDANRDMMMKSCREFSIFVGENCIDPQVFLEIEQAAAQEEEIKNG